MIKNKMKATVSLRFVEKNLGGQPKIVFIFPSQLFFYNLNKKDIFQSKNFSRSSR
ncbi:MAG: hypothetical protein OP8BY_1131 [Candidatus Saccharicenans subterraneus]|uniref:Uncharacterized protein n=1 Tax=Candidatus Saccharicenans subterraneus TaxID=2508984 RepID=A0A3E2BJV8_9BACT|nr:MAG: hypothetical protein OP8BY_1131 [Candidatus Saccharicenans subterraneum]